MKKTVIISIFVVAAALVGYLVYDYSMRGHNETAEEVAAFSVTHESVLQEFMDDQTGSSAKYIDKVIEVTGPVYQIDKVDGKVTGVKISSDESSIVSCTFQNPVEESLLTGIITVKGVCAGFDYDPDSMIPEPSLQLNRAAIVTK